MIRQYLEIKAKHKDELVFFRLGDFYELFFEDAQVAAELLGLTLTSRQGKIPMCGVPFHAVSGYIERLVAAGHRVALCEQTDVIQDGLVVRKVTRIYTPGTLFSDDNSERFIMSIYVDSDRFCMEYCNISTGDFYTTNSDNMERLLDEIEKISPAEIIVCPEFAKLSGSGRVFDGGLLNYLNYVGLNSVSQIIRIKPYKINDFMSIDRLARRNLELFESILERAPEGSLFWVLNATLTPPGGRLLRKWLEQPLLSVDEINIRLEAVGELKENGATRQALRAALDKIGDLERFCAKIVHRRTSGRDILTLAKSLKAISELLAAAKPLKSRLNSYFANEVDSLNDIYENIQGVVLPTAPPEIDSGGIFANGYNPVLDAARAQARHLEAQLEEYAQSQREETGIKSLKIGQNKVFGYYIEVPNSQRDKVPADYLPRQSLVGSQRYSSEALKLLEMEILATNQQAIDLEYDLFMDLRNGIAAESGRILATAHALAHMDALQSLAEVAARYGYVSPQIDIGGQLEIIGGRHPVIERLNPDFVPNDLSLNDTDSKIAIITGPNMAGKSTYMRQSALIAIMAQMGGFVPAESAKIPVFDAIFTRVGAADDLAGGRSTFMVEMSELAHILGNATAESLILLDEVGRGTGTTDGLSIAMATIEHIAEKIGAKTLFATHYHELVAAEGWVEGVVNLSMQVEKCADSIKFLWKVAPGGTNKSHGIFVAEMAGLPAELVKRSGEIHEKLVLQGFFDEDVLARTEAVSYQFIREKVRRYRIFLEEYGDIIEELGLNSNNGNLWADGLRQERGGD
jgi:DNA mismatch repair protein MutS